MEDNKNKPKKSNLKGLRMLLFTLALGISAPELNAYAQTVETENFSKSENEQENEQENKQEENSSGFINKVKSFFQKDNDENEQEEDSGWLESIKSLFENNNLENEKERFDLLKSIKSLFEEPDLEHLQEMANDKTTYQDYLNETATAKVPRELKFLKPFINENTVYGIRCDQYGNFNINNPEVINLSSLNSFDELTTMYPVMDSEIDGFKIVQYDNFGFMLVYEKNIVNYMEGEITTQTTLTVDNGKEYRVIKGTPIEIRGKYVTCGVLFENDNGEIVEQKLTGTIPSGTYKITQEAPPPVTKPTTNMVKIGANWNHRGRNTYFGVPIGKNQYEIYTDSDGFTSIKTSPGVFLTEEWNEEDRSFEVLSDGSENAIYHIVMTHEEIGESIYNRWKKIQDLGQSLNKTEFIKLCYILKDYLVSGEMPANRENIIKALTESNEVEILTKIMSYFREKRDYQFALTKETSNGYIEGKKCDYFGNKLLMYEDEQPVYIQSNKLLPVRFLEDGRIIVQTDYLNERYAIIEEKDISTEVADEYKTTKKIKIQKGGEETTIPKGAKVQIVGSQAIFTYKEKRKEKNFYCSVEALDLEDGYKSKGKEEIIVQSATMDQYYVKGNPDMVVYGGNYTTKDGEGYITIYSDEFGFGEQMKASDLTAVAPSAGYAKMQLLKTLGIDPDKIEQQNLEAIAYGNGKLTENNEQILEIDKGNNLDILDSTKENRFVDFMGAKYEIKSMLMPLNSASLHTTRHGTPQTHNHFMIHDTAWPGKDAEGIAQYFLDGADGRYVSSHYVLCFIEGEENIYEVIPPYERAAAALHGYNENVLHIEVAIKDETAEFTDAQMRNLTDFVARVCIIDGVEDIDDFLLRHSDTQPEDRSDPRPFQAEERWKAFKEGVNERIQLIKEYKKKAEAVRAQPGNNTSEMAIREGYVKNVMKYMGERERGKGNTNDNIFGERVGHNKVPWCNIFVYYNAEECGIPPEIIPRYGAVIDTKKYYEARNLAYTQNNGPEFIPQIGDLRIIYNSQEEHINVVVDVKKEADGKIHVYTIGGNENNMVSPKPVDHILWANGETYCTPRYSDMVEKTEVNVSGHIDESYLPDSIVVDNEEQIISNEQKQNIVIMYNYFIDYGLSHNQACALLGEAYRESSWHPYSENSIHARGIFQWLTYTNELVEFANSKGKAWQDLYLQLQFTTEADPSDIDGKRPIDALKEIGGSIEECSYFWSMQFEKYSRDTYDTQRARVGEQISESIIQKQKTRESTLYNKKSSSSNLFNILLFLLIIEMELSAVVANGKKKGLSLREILGSFDSVANATTEEIANMSPVELNDCLGKMKTMQKAVVSELLRERERKTEEDNKSKDRECKSPMQKRRESMKDMLKRDAVTANCRQREQETKRGRNFNIRSGR